MNWSYVFVNFFLITVSSASCTYPNLPWQRPFWGGMSDTGPCRAEWSQDKSRGQTGRLLKKKEPKGFYQEGKEKTPRVQINKITPRFFYAHPDLHPSRPEMPHTRPKMSGVLLTCSLATIDGGEKKVVALRWLKFPGLQCLIPSMAPLSLHGFMRSPTLL